MRPDRHSVRGRAVLAWLARCAFASRACRTIDRGRVVQRVEGLFGFEGVERLFHFEGVLVALVEVETSDCVDDARGIWLGAVHGDHRCVRHPLFVLCVCVCVCARARACVCAHMCVCLRVCVTLFFFFISKIQ